jgi:hypothetical protein
MVSYHVTNAAAQLHTDVRANGVQSLYVDHLSSLMCAVALQPR